MKINETSRIGGIHSYRNNQETKTQVGGKKSSARDEVQISSEAKELLGSVDNRARVEDLKKAVSSGTYHVEAGKVAEKLLPHLFD